MKIFACPEDLPKDHRPPAYGCSAAFQLTEQPFHIAVWALKSSTRCSGEKEMLKKWKAEPSSQRVHSRQPGLQFHTVSALPGANCDLTWELLSWVIGSTLPRPRLVEASGSESSYRSVWVSSPWLSDKSSWELCFHAGIFNLSQLFLANSLAAVASRTSPICPKLISFRLQGVDI